MDEINYSLPETEKAPLILIADDDRSLRALLRLAMEEEGYRVVEAKNGQECLAEYRRCQPDMVLLDAVMPDMDGFTCCQKLRHFAGNDRTPILTITVLDDEESVEKAFASGATDYITKPIHWAVLSQRVHRLLIASQVLFKAEKNSQELRIYQAWSNFLGKTLEYLSQSVKVLDVLPAIIELLRSFLEVERIIFLSAENQVVVESVALDHPSVGEVSPEILSLKAHYSNDYNQGKVIAIDDLTQANLPSNIYEQLTQLKIQALLIVPVINQDKLWGLLCIHSCNASRHWESLEIERLSILAKLLGLGFLSYII
jgi:DNA-binding response OmpR family regulator